MRHKNEVIKTQTFKVNEYIKLKLKNGITTIYVDGKEFQQCIRLVLKFPKDEAHIFNQINSIDEAVEVYNKHLSKGSIIQGEPGKIITDLTHGISPETEFWGHCSNLQVWYENSYDTRLMHSNLAFPLLKRLTEAGDSIAKKVFKDEVAKRFENGNNNVRQYLLIERFLKELNKEEMIALAQQIGYPNIANSFLLYLMDIGDEKAIKILKRRVLKKSAKQFEDFIFHYRTLFTEEVYSTLLCNISYFRKFEDVTDIDSSITRILSMMDIIKKSLIKTKPEGRKDFNINFGTLKCLYLVETYLIHY